MSKKREPRRVVTNADTEDIRRFRAEQEAKFGKRDQPLGNIDDARLRPRLRGRGRS